MAIEEKLKTLPSSPGVYIMKGHDAPHKGEEEILYIGKAKNLRARVLSYFRRSSEGRYSIPYIVSKTDDIDYIVTSNEKEALILEDVLLKKHKPRYNIRLKDDKTYVSVKITVNEKFPRLTVTRRIKDDGARYFGPYASAKMVKDTVKYLRRIFPLCICSPHEFKNRTRPCLDYQLGLCASPATGLISFDAYRELTKGAVMFLEGRNRELIRCLKVKMNEAAKSEEYEKAAALRDRIRAIEATIEEQKVVSGPGTNQDVFGLFRDGIDVVVEGLFIRDGRLSSTRDFPFFSTALPDTDIFSSFLSQFYKGARFVPDEVLTSADVAEKDVLIEWLSEKKGKKVEIKNPVRGRKLKLVEMAGINAKEAMKMVKAKEDSTAPEEIKKRLRLTKAPDIIEAFDISNIGGKAAVGAMVTFKGAIPDKSRYRLYKIRLSSGPDDYAMMKEVLLRRYGNAGFALPGLILIDGGKGQLSMAQAALKEIGIKEVSIAAIAKERAGKTGLHEKLIKGDRVYLPNVKDPVFLKENKGDMLLRRIRDEAHRFAVNYHRRLRKKEIGSTLENIPGVGKKRRISLFEKFGDVEGIKNASVEELIKIPGITEKIAASIKAGIIPAPIFQLARRP